MEINYKGFTAKIFFSSDTHIFWGEVVNSDDLITFQAVSLTEATELFYETIDRYLVYQKNGIEYS